LEDRGQKILKMRIGSAAEEPIDYFCTFDIIGEYSPLVKKYKFTETNNNIFNLYTGNPSNNTLLAYDIDMEIDEINVGDGGYNKLTFSGTVTQYDTSSMQDETYTVTNGIVFFTLF
jgi:hypothetical protein